MHLEDADWLFTVMANHFQKNLVKKTADTFPGAAKSEKLTWQTHAKISTLPRIE